jgi:hypothetical protein
MVDNKLKLDFEQRRELVRILGYVNDGKQLWPRMYFRGLVKYPRHKSQRERLWTMKGAGSRS